MLRRTERIRRARRVRREPIVDVVVLKPGEEPPPKRDGHVTITVTLLDMSPVSAHERPDAVGDQAKTLEPRASVRQSRRPRNVRRSARTSAVPTR